MGIVRYLWALPATCVGAALGLLALVTGGRARLVDGVVEVAARLPAMRRFGAVTFGHVIIGISPECLAACRAHEHVHVRQYERWGVLFFPLYAGSSVVQWLRGRDPYRDNRFEREAYGEAPKD
jgi:hypothetical protein